VKLPDWIQELYLKELMHKSINGEKTHGKDRSNEQEIKGAPKRNRGIPKQMHPRTSTDQI
jgi:hypothetical protein